MIPSVTNLSVPDLKSTILRNPLMGSPTLTAMEAIALMNNAQLAQEGRSSCVLVCENDQLVGILTERDVVHLSAQPQPLDCLELRQVMTQAPITLRESDFSDLLAVLELLQYHRIRHLPILDEQDCPVGLVTQDSLLQILTQMPFNEAFGDIGALTDIKDSNLEEQHLQALNSQIEAEVKERTTQIQAREQDFLRATRLKNEFLANMSHELRTPLNALLGMTEGLKAGVFGEIVPEQHDALEIIEHSGSNLLKLINSILDLAHFESDRIELERKPTSVMQLCQSSVAFVKQQAFKKRIRIEIKPTPHLPDLCVDERYIRQVLVNLLSNAVKFTPEGGQIRLDFRPHPLMSDPNPNPSASQPNLWLEVIDTGIGIAPEHLSNLFQPFVQIDAALNRKYKGSGLGLALVKRMVESHGGQVEVTSMEGGGSCFAISLPCVMTTKPPSDAPEPDFCVPNTLTPKQSQRRRSPLILLAEDSEDNIIAMSSYLRVKGFRILVARNGEEAIDLAQSEHPNLILMDVQLPGMDGREAMRKIRQDLDLVDVPMIAITGLAMSGDRDLCLAAGANDYLSKPFKLEELTATIQALLIHKEEKT